MVWMISSFYFSEAWIFISAGVFFSFCHRIANQFTSLFSAHEENNGEHFFQIHIFYNSALHLTTPPKLLIHLVSSHGNKNQSFGLEK